jgi:hypothetical protein
MVILIPVHSAEVSTALSLLVTDGIKPKPKAEVSVAAPDLLMKERLVNVVILI